MPAVSRSWVAVLAICVSATLSSAAAFQDGQVIAAWDFHGTAPDMTSIIGPVNTVVGPGVELASFGWSNFVSVDLSDTNILVTLNIDQPFGYFEVLRFTDLNGTIPDFTGVTVNPATNYAGFDASRVYFTADMIDVNVTALHGLQGQQISLDLAGPLSVAVDVRPGGCANLLPTTSTRLLPLAIRGGATFDVAQIDPASVRLEGVAAVGSRTVDAAGAECAAEPDGYPDLLMGFRIPDIVATLGTVVHGETRALKVRGQLRQEFGASPIQGDDVVLIVTPQ